MFKLAKKDKSIAKYVIEQQVDKINLHQIIWFAQGASLVVYETELVSFDFKAYHHVPYNELLNEFYSACSTNNDNDVIDKLSRSFIHQIMTVLKKLLNLEKFEGCCLAEKTHASPLYKTNHKKGANYENAGVIDKQQIRQRFGEDAFEHKFIQEFQKYIKKREEERLEYLKSLTPAKWTCTS